MGKNNDRKIIKAKPRWHADVSIKRLHGILITVGILLLTVVAGGCFWAYRQITKPYVPPKAVSGQEEASGLPVYEDEFLLQLANIDHVKDEKEKPELTNFEGVSIDRRMIPALSSMLKAAAEDGASLRIKFGYISKQNQQQEYEKKVKYLQKSKKLSMALAEREAEKTVPPGGKSDSQTGLSVYVAAPDEKKPFTNTIQYQWLMRHADDYGFVFRYPAGKETATGHKADEHYLRFVGVQNAAHMCQLSMSLEEYVDYKAHQ